jgi:Zn-dependent protease
MFSIFIQELFTSPLTYLMALAAMAFGLVLHNVVQALVAASLGDNTAKSQGFTSTEPRAHINPIYLIWLAIFGFAIPNTIPVKSYNLRGRSSSEVLIWLLGPISLVVWAFVLILVGALLNKFVGDSAQSIVKGFYSGAGNVISLAVLFIFPVPPLDGARAVRAFGNREINRVLDQIEQFTNSTPFGFMIIFIVLSFLGVTRVMTIAVASVISSILQSVGLSL